MTQALLVKPADAGAAREEEALEAQFSPAAATSGRGAQQQDESAAHPPPVIPVSTTTFGMEWSAHVCSRRLAREVKTVFPGMREDPARSGLLVVPTFQRASAELLTTGERIDAERDRLLERFMAWSEAVVARLRELGHWADYIDPCSGLPMVEREQGGGSCVYSEVDGALALRPGFRAQNAGCCKVLLHPKWGAAVYPATLFARAPAAALAEAARVADRAVIAAGWSTGLLNADD